MNGAITVWNRKGGGKPKRAGHIYAGRGIKPAEKRSPFKRIGAYFHPIEKSRKFVDSQISRLAKQYQKRGSRQTGNIE